MKGNARIVFLTGIFLAAACAGAGEIVLFDASKPAVVKPQDGAAIELRGDALEVRTQGNGKYPGVVVQGDWVDCCDTPYPETRAGIREVGYQLYGIRSSAGSD